MRRSQFFVPTLKETPADAEVISHQLMLRAGMIQKLGAGLYSWLPLGLRTLQKVIQVIREELNAAGCQELLMPTIQPAELWQESHRWEVYGKELLRITDRHDHEYCYGPTHEEIITDIARRELKSYKQLPVTLYQIQTKFRDEIRPRFGVIRAREFLMKDAYSFHADQASLEETYQKMYDVYHQIFTRLGLTFRPVIADTGNIGGSASYEFQVLADSGEDTIVYSDTSNYAANIEMVENKNIAEGDPSPDGQGHVHITKGIEVGQIFQLGTKYSEPMKATVLNETGESIPMVMGCYGIGVSRTVAAAIEQNHDDRGIIWPDPMAPFQIALIPICMNKSERVRIAAEALHKKLEALGYEVMFDDRDERPGVMFSEADLMGIPHRLVISDKLLDQGVIEYKYRRDQESTNITNDQLLDFLKDKINK